MTEDLTLQHGSNPPIDGPLEITLDVDSRNERWFRDWQLGKPLKYSGSDIDNRIGSVFDLLQKAGIVHDDCQFYKVCARKRLGTDGAEHLITIQISHYEGDSR